MSFYSAVTHWSKAHLFSYHVAVYNLKTRPLLSRHSYVYTFQFKCYIR